MENPCRKDCPRRSPTCHSDCPDYEKYRRYLKWKKYLINKSKVYDDYIQIKKYDMNTNKLKESVKKK